MGDDEDVVLAGSQLHQHLLDCGYTEAGHLETAQPSGGRIPGHTEERDKRLEVDGGRRLTSLIWPDSADKLLEVELAQLVLRSELLVTEDEEFINNYILTEDTMEQYKKELEGGQGSVMKDVLLFSGSLAAVAGAVFFFSERTRAAVTAAAVLPTAMAAASSMRIGSRVSQSREAEEFKKMIKQMLGDMKQFKMVLRKSLNLIQGMEMMNQGYISFASSIGQQSQSELKAEAESSDGSKLSKALCQRSSFISLRRAIYTHAVQMISVYRQAIEKLMIINPLAEHIDLRDHYLAFIDLEKFGLEKEIQDERLSVRQLKDTIQLSLLQQSEYLRRFSLVFCQKVQEEDSLNKTGVLKHVKEIISKLRTVSDKMSNVLEYHQALGLVPLQELDTKCLALKKQQSLDQVKKLMPLRHVYTSLFSTGLHLQNSLLKLRHMEGLFETLEKSKDKETVANFMPDEQQMLEWLQGFQDIQSELNVCITCLDGGVEEMEVMARPGSSHSDTRASTASDKDTEEPSSRDGLIDENEEIAHMDEVFEAFISHDFSVEGLGFEDDFVPREPQTGKEAKQSKRVLTELKSVLNGRLKETEVREAKALSRQNGIEENGMSHEHEDPSKSLMTTNILGLSQETDTDADSILSDTNTIKSGDLGPPNGHARASNGRCQGETQSVCSLSVSVSSRTMSGSSEDNRSDVEVDKSRRIYSRTAMTSSYCQSRHKSPSKPKRLGANLRSMSTPDIKNLEKQESSSPYVSLHRTEDVEPEYDTDSDLDSSCDDEDVSNRDRVNLGLPQGIDDDSSSSTDTSSGLQMFRKPKTLRRPANRRMSSKLKECLMKTSSVEGLNSGVSSLPPAHSLYVAKQREALFANHQPPGFDRKLAVDAIAKVRQLRGHGTKAGNMTEEYFGSSDSD